MPFQNMSEEDLVAVLSFIRSQEPVKHVMPNTEYTAVGKIIFSMMGSQPVGPRETPPVSVPRDTSVAYGKYLAYSVANCYGCHTDRNLQTGVFTGKPFAGGLYFAPDPFSDGKSFVTPNLTTDPETGVMARWDEATFMKRFRSGRVQPCV